MLNTQETDKNSRDDNDRARSESEPEEIISVISPAWKYVGLAALSFIIFIVFMTYSLPGPLQSRFMDDMSYSAFDYSQLMTSNAWPSALCFISGYFVDRFTSLNTGLLLFIGVFCFGNLLFAFGVLTKFYWIIIISRILNGFGGESLIVMCNCYTVKWFSQGRLNFAFAVLSCLSSLEPGFTFQICNPLYEFINEHLIDPHSIISRQKTLGLTILVIVSGACIFSTISSLVVIKIHSKILESNVDTIIITNEERRQSIKEFFNFPFPFWILITAISLIYAAKDVFISFSLDLFMTSHHLTIDNANNMMTMFSVIIFVVSPAVGYLIDRTGGNIYYLNLACGGGVVSIAFLGLTQYHPTLPLIIFSLSMAIFESCSYPLVALSVDPSKESTALGLLGSFISINSGFGFMVAGLAIDHYGYFGFGLLLIIVLTVALVLCGVLALYMNCGNNIGHHRELGTITI